MAIKIKRYKNGATLVYKKRKENCTTVSAGFLFGSNRDNYEEPTIHFCEHMFFKETENKNEEQLQDAMSKTFTMYNAATTTFYTYIDFCRSNKVLEDCFKLSSEMLLQTKYKAKTVNSEKGVIKQELVRRQTSPYAKIQSANMRILTTNYHSETQVLGSAEEIDNITPKKLKSFRDKNFISQNFYIAVNSKLPFFKIKKLSEKYFINSLKSDPNYPVDKTVFSNFDKNGSLCIENYPYEKAMCKLTIKLKELGDPIKTTNLLHMLAQISNGITGELFKRLREKGLVYDVYVNYYKMPIFAFEINFECTNENVNKVLDKIGEIINQWKTIPFSEDLISQKKLNAVLSTDETNPPHVYPSALFSTYLTNRKDIFTKRYAKDNKKAYNNITPADLQNFCQKLFSNPELVYVTILTDQPSEKFYNYEKIQKIITNIK
ncbi:MAG: insulinase family protein [Clostridiales bacterium]|nr:insulinase family protein [Clostridiales bacterium]